MTDHWIKNVIGSIAERGRELLKLDSGDVDSLNIETLCQQLLSGQGEASGIALSQEILRNYHQMNDDEKLAFFHILETVFQADLEKIEDTLKQYKISGSAKDLSAFTTAVEAPRQELFRRLNMAPNGTANLVTLRADLLKQLRNYPSLRAVDDDLKHILSSWFNRGFLQLSSIDWNSPAQVLEKLINYESVHEIQGWDDLRRRLMKDRRCFAFFHPAMPEEPLIFVEVAFVQGLTSEVGSLIDPETPELDPRQADTAIFYSINNTQAGLRGISFGNFLIKQVLNELTHEFPWIKVSSTLSPIPAFRSTLDKWLDTEESCLQHEEFSHILQLNSAVIKDLAAQSNLDHKQGEKSVLKSLLDKTLCKDNKMLSALLADLALSYLTLTNEKGRLADPVAMFHLSNGARLERLNSCADMTEHGLASSYGMMVNYLYDMKDVEANHEVFVSNGKIVMSDTLNKAYKKLLRVAV